MEKRGGREWQAARGGIRPYRPTSGAIATKSAEKRGLGVLDLIGIAVVIAFLGLALGALVAKQSERAGLPVPEWLEQIAAPLNDWVSRSEAGEGPSSAPQGAR